MSNKALFKEMMQKDVELRNRGTDYSKLSPLEPCRCGGSPHVDVSMALIQCDNCGLCFEYRYNRGVVPYFTWQALTAVTPYSKEENDDEQG